MLPKSRRVPRELLTHALSQGRRHNSPSLLLTVDTHLDGPSRFSFSVSKKVLRGATDRNTFRRRGYSVIGKYLKNIKPGFLCVFSFKKGSAKIKFTQIENEILDLLRATGVLE